MRPVRVALLATSVDFGGIERVLLNLLQHMDGGVELVPIVFTRTDTSDDGFFDRLRAMGVACEKLYVNSIRPTMIVNPVVNLAQAIARVRRHRVDLIHSHGYRADVFALLIAKCLGLPLISTCHGFVSNDRRLRFYNALDALVLRSFTRIIAVSAPMKDYLVSRGVPAEKIEVITNAVPAVSAMEREVGRRATRNRLGIADDDFVFGFTGRLSEEKGIQHLLAAAPRILAERPSARVLIVGDGPRRTDLEDAARAGGMDRRVDFVGFQGDTSPWYAAMDAFVLPSLTEGTPMALLEAMAHGLPAIASAVGGVPAVIGDRVSGLLVPPGDRAALQDAMRTVISDASLRQAVSDGAVRSVEARYGVVEWVGRIKRLYAQSLADRPYAWRYSRL